MNKRWRAPKAKPGQLKIAYGKHEGDTDIFYCNGGYGAERCDARMLSSFFQSLKYPGEKTMVDELISRGYDITTLKFTIQMRSKKT